MWNDGCVRVKEDGDPVTVRRSLETCVSYEMSLECNTSSYSSHVEETTLP